MLVVPECLSTGVEKFTMVIWLGISGLNDIAGLLQYAQKDFFFAYGKQCYLVADSCLYRSGNVRDFSYAPQLALAQRYR